MKRSAVFRVLVPAALILAAYLVTRLAAIKDLPPFNDEIIYVRWAQQGYFDAAKRLISLSDGKQPLFVWFTSLLMGLVPSPLAAGRLVSVASGAAAAIGAGVLGWLLFRSYAVGLVSSLLYVLFPEALLLDRFALYDSLLAALWIWNLIVMYALVRSPSLGLSLVLALTMGAAMLTKSSSVFLFAVAPVMLFAFPGTKRTRLRATGYFALAAVVGLLYQSVQHLSPLVSYIGEKNAVFAYGFSDIQAIPFAAQIAKNAPLFLGWTVSYVTLPLLIAALVPLFSGAHERRPAVFLWTSTALMLAAVIVAGKTVYPRHLFFLTVPVLILAAAGFVRIWMAFGAFWKRVVLVLVCFAPIAVMSIGLLADFASARLPAIDRFQYVEGWPAGWGVKEIARYVTGEAAKGPITIVTEGTFGSLPTTAMELYLGNYPQVTVVPVDDTTYALPQSIDWSGPVYAVINKTQQIPKAWNARELLSVRRGNTNEFMRLLELSRE